MLSGSSDQHSKRAESRLIIYNVEGSEIIMTASASAAGLYFQTQTDQAAILTRRNGLLGSLSIELPVYFLPLFSVLFDFGRSWSLLLINGRERR